MWRGESPAQNQGEQPNTDWAHIELLQVALVFVISKQSAQYTRHKTFFRDSPVKHKKSRNNFIAFTYCNDNMRKTKCGRVLGSVNSKNGQTDLSGNILNLLSMAGVVLSAVASYFVTSMHISLDQ